MTGDRTSLGSARADEIGAVAAPLETAPLETAPLETAPLEIVPLQTGQRADAADPLERDPGSRAVSDAGHDDAHASGLAEVGPIDVDVVRTVAAMGEPARSGPARYRSTDGELLEFIAPGLVHALGNHLFAIQGCAHVMREGQVNRRQRATILEASGLAESALDVLRLLSEGDGAAPRREQAGVILSRLAPICRVPLRDRGLRLEIQHSSARRPRVVDAHAFTRAIVDLVLRVGTHLPAFVEGCLRVDLADQDASSVSLAVRVEFDPSCLPFPMDVARLGREYARAHDPDGITVEIVDGGLRIRAPTAG